MTVQRYDSVPIRDPVIDKQTGFLYVYRVPIAQTMVQPYLKADGSIDHEAKLPTELLSDETVSSANNRPVTNGHPHELVTKDNSKKYMKGFTTSNAHVEGNMLFNDIAITDADMINDIMKNGKRELSIGFQTEVVPEKGEFNGVKYDSVQKNIRINHVAVVNKGRAGHNVRLLGDSAEAIDDETSKGGSMDSKDTTQIRIDGADVTVSTRDADKIMKLDAANADKQKQIDALNAQIKKLTAERDQLQGNAKSAQDKADSVEKELADYKKKFTGDALEKKVEERLALVDSVKPYLGDSYDFKGKDAKALKIEAIKAVKGDSLDFDIDKASDGFIDGYFQGLEKPHSVSGYAGPSVKGDSALKEDEAEAEKLRWQRYHLKDKEED